MIESVLKEDVGAGQEKPTVCLYCDGEGYQADYVGLMLVPTQMLCEWCDGTGHTLPPSPKHKAQFR